MLHICPLVKQLNSRLGEMREKINKFPTDELLINAIQQGDKNSMGELYLRYIPIVRNRCLSFTKNTEIAKDLAQDIMLKVIDKVNSFKGDSRFSTWLYALTFNYCIDHVKKTQFFTSLEECNDIMTYEELELESAVKKELKIINAERALAAISKKDQQLLIMKYQYNKSIKELQDLYNLSASAVKMRLLRAREKATDLY